jgi:DNA-binding transcriptional LysR family regulator
MDKFHLVGVFVAVVDTGGFAGAARKLSISPPAVTRAISELERQLQVQLLTRTTRVVRVTDAGARYAEDCRRILAEMRDADEALSGSHNELHGSVAVTAPVLFGAKFVAPILADYLGQHTQMNATCLFVDRVVNLIEEGMDVGIRIGQLADSSLRAIRVGTVSRVVCASPAYLTHRATPLHPEDLKNHCVVSANVLDAAPTWHFTNGRESMSVKLNPRVITATNDSAIAMLLNGFGVTRLLSYQVEEHVRRGDLIRLLGDWQTEPLPVHIVHREGRHASSKVRVLMDIMIERLRANPILNSLTP